MTFRMSSAEVEDYFASRKIAATQHSYTVGTHEIHYVKIRQRQEAPVLFIHGSPGSLSAFIPFSRRFESPRSELTYYNRSSGFGYSNFGVVRVA